MMQWDIANLVYLEHLSKKCNLLTFVMNKEGVESGLHILQTELEKVQYYLLKIFHTAQHLKPIE